MSSGTITAATPAWVRGFIKPRWQSSASSKILALLGRLARIAVSRRKEYRADELACLRGSRRAARDILHSLRHSGIEPVSDFAGDAAGRAFCSRVAVQMSGARDCRPGAVSNI